MASNQFKGGGHTSEEEENIEIEIEAEDRRREAALASNPCLRPNFKPTNNTITQQHITKFQELRRKRLQIKSKLNKTHINKSKGDKSHSKDYKDRDSKDTTESSSTPIEITSTNANSNNHTVSSTNHKKRHKLHWGVCRPRSWNYVWVSYQSSFAKPTSPGVLVQTSNHIRLSEFFMKTSYKDLASELNPD
ncbi:hypothetical protein ACFE04_006070 [Oxalis oulophora]